MGGFGQVVAYLLVTSGAAVMEILYLAYKGDRIVTWSEACSSYGSFCSRLIVALVLHALALCCFFVLAVISAYRVFSMFEPPLPSKEAEEQTTWNIYSLFFYPTTWVMGILLWWVGALLPQSNVKNVFFFSLLSFVFFWLVIMWKMLCNSFLIFVQRMWNWLLVAALLCTQLYF